MANEINWSNPEWLSEDFTNQEQLKNKRPWMFFYVRLEEWEFQEFNKEWTKKKQSPIISTRAEYVTAILRRGEYPDMQECEVIE